MRSISFVRTRPRLTVTALLLAVLASVGFLDNLETSAGVGTTTAVVGIAHAKDVGGNWVTDPTAEQIDAAVREAVALAGGLPLAIGPGKKIVIQPNLVEAGWPSGSGVVPNVQTVRTVIKMCLEMGATPDNVTVCEGTAAFRIGTGQGGYTDRQMTLKELKDSGLDPDGDMWVEDTDGSHIARCVDANNVGQVYPNYPGYSGPYNSAYVTEVVKAGFLINRVYVVPNCVVQADVLIRIPTLKNHGNAGITGALKLAFGFAPTDIYHQIGYNNYKHALLHQNAWGYGELETNSRGMADMTYCRPPDFIVCDALVGITNGPVGEGGSVNTASPKMAFIMASSDPVAIDTIHALCCGYTISSILGIARAASLGLGQNDPGKIQIAGDHVKDVRRSFPVRGCAQIGNAVAPTLSDLTIQNNTHVCGRLAVGPVGAYDANPGLCKSELYVDGALVDSNNVSAYYVSWLAAGAAAGAHTVRYTIYDKMLNETSLSRTVHVHTGDGLLSALGLPDGTPVSIGPVVFTGRGLGIDGYTFFVASPDGLRGLRVSYSSAAPSHQYGRRMCVYGTLTTVDGQRCLNCTAYSLYELGDAVKPRYFRNSSLGGADLNAQTPGVTGGRGPYNLGCLVKTAGKVHAGGSDYFFIDDGSFGELGGASKLRVVCGSISQPGPGSYVSVVGFSCCEPDGSASRPFLLLRSDSDIVVHKSP